MKRKLKKLDKLLTLAIKLLMKRFIVIQLLKLIINSLYGKERKPQLLL